MYPGGFRQSLIIPVLDRKNPLGILNGHDDSQRHGGEEH
jgi:hypothetical protein